MVAFLICNEKICFFCVDWLQPIPGDSRNARCGICLVVLPAHHAGLCRHAQDAKHIKRVAEGNSASTSQINSVDRGSDIGNIEGLDGLVSSNTAVVCV